MKQLINYSSGRKDVCSPCWLVVRYAGRNLSWETRALNNYIHTYSAKNLRYAIQGWETKATRNIRYLKWLSAHRNVEATNKQTNKGESV